MTGLDSLSCQLKFQVIGSFFSALFIDVLESLPQGGHSIVKNWGAGWIVWGLEFWLGKDILGFFKKIDLDDS